MDKGLKWFIEYQPTDSDKWFRMGERVIHSVNGPVTLPPEGHTLEEATWLAETKYEELARRSRRLRVNFRVVQDV